VVVVRARGMGSVGEVGSLEVEVVGMARPGEVGALRDLATQGQKQGRRAGKVSRVLERTTRDAQG